MSALALLGNLASLATMYLLLQADFVAAAQVIVYAGAVMVMFLFVIAYVGPRGELRRTAATRLADRGRGRGRGRHPGRRSRWRSAARAFDDPGRGRRLRLAAATSAPLLVTDYLSPSRSSRCS